LHDAVNNNRLQHIAILIALMHCSLIDVFAVLHAMHLAHTQDLSCLLEQTWRHSNAKPHRQSVRLSDTVRYWTTANRGAAPGRNSIDEKHNTDSAGSIVK